MFKTFLAALAAACLLAIVITSLGLASILGPVGVILWAVGLVLVALLFVYGRRAAAAFLAFLAVGAALSGCGTLGMGGLGGGAANGTQVVSGIADAIKAINSSCTGTFATNITFAPPLPPVGNLNINQTCGVKTPTPQDPTPTPAQFSATVDAAVAKALAAKPQ